MGFSVTILTLFPDMFPGVLAHSVVGRALEKGLWALDVQNIRDFGLGNHNAVDDTPYGGGAGMVMRADVVANAIHRAKKTAPRARVVFLAPTGERLTQAKVREFSAHEDGLILLCGHYEGIDQRVVDAEVDDVISIGDYVLSGGEVAAMVLADAVVRLQNGTLGGDASLHEESFDIIDENGAPLVEYPHYTRPETWEGATIPPVLTSGHHGKIKQWRLEQAKKRTEVLSRK